MKKTKKKATWLPIREYFKKDDSRRLVSGKSELGYANKLSHQKQNNEKCWMKYIHLTYTHIELCNYK